MTHARRTIAALLSLCLLTGCGDSRLERAGNGAMIGLAVGGISGGVCCGHPRKDIGTGALLGAAIGAILGALSPEPIFFNDHHS